MRRRSFLASPLALGLAGLESRPLADERRMPGLGQLVIAGFRGTEVSDPEVDLARRCLADGLIAGVILLGRNIRSPEQLSRLTASLASASADFPPVISIDQEGGAVARLGRFNGFSDWTSAEDIARLGMRNVEIFDYYHGRAQEMAQVGINLNYAPVVDLNVNPLNPIVGALGRSFGRSVDTVVRFAENFIRAHRAAEVATCLKHFPGHGSSTVDSHLGTADVSETWTAAEVVPFQALTDAGLADSVMNSHVLHPYFSDSPWIPASLSRESVREIRDGLGFSGPIITDDMQMRSITDMFEPRDAAVAALNAGNSLLIYSNYRREDSLGALCGTLSALDTAWNEGKIDWERVEGQISRVHAFREGLRLR